MITLNMLNFAAHLDLWRENHIMNFDMILARFGSQFLKKWSVLHSLTGITESQPGFSKNKWCQTSSDFLFFFDRIARLVDQRKGRYKTYLDFIKVIGSFSKLVKRYGLGVSTAMFLSNWLIRYIPVCYLTDKCWLRESFW